MVQFRNRSALRGAEQLLINAMASVETQTGSGIGARRASPPTSTASMPSCWCRA